MSLFALSLYSWFIQKVTRQDTKAVTMMIVTLMIRKSMQQKKRKKKDFIVASGNEVEAVWLNKTKKGVVGMSHVTILTTRMTMTSLHWK